VAKKTEEQESAEGTDEFKKNLEAEKAKEKPDPESGKFVIEVAPESEDDDSEPTSPQPGIRDQKKAERSRQRYKEQKEAREAAEQQAAELRSENERLRIQAEVAQQVARTVQRPDQPKPKDPLDAEIEAISTKQRLIYQEMQQKQARLSPEEYQKEWDKAYIEAQELLDKRQALVTQKAIRDHAPQQDVRQEAIVAQLRYNHPDVMARPDIFEWVKRDYANRLALGAPDSPATVNLSMDAGRAAFRLPGNRPAPSAATRRQFSGPSAGGHPSNTDTPKQVDMSNKAIRGMAQKMYPNLPPEEAWAKWAKEVG
jgi:hypothetical protein